MLHFNSDIPNLKSEIVWSEKYQICLKDATDFMQFLLYNYAPWVDVVHCIGSDNRIRSRAGVNGNIVDSIEKGIMLRV